jgi:hypothetical protein
MEPAVLVGEGDERPVPRGGERLEGTAAW